MYVGVYRCNAIVLRMQTMEKIGAVSAQRMMKTKLKSHYILFTLFGLIVFVMLVHSVCNKYGSS